MIERFENLTSGVSRVYKVIQKIKKQRMTALGLKGTHVMCIHYLSGHPEGMTAASLSRLSLEDKAATSRTLSELEDLGLVFYTDAGGPEGKKYRAHIALTPEGEKYARKINGLILQATEEGGTDITEEEREIFYRVLFQISGNLERFCRTISKE